MILSLAVSLGVIVQRYSPLLPPHCGRLSTILWTRQNDVKDDHNHKHNDQEPHNYYQNDPPHVHNPIYRLLEASRVQKEICQAIDSTIVVHNHTLVEEVTVTGKILAGEANLQVASLTVG